MVKQLKGNTGAKVNVVALKDALSTGKTYLFMVRRTGNFYVITSSLCYVFLDEVQRVSGWAGACRTLRIRNCSVFISGSNSKLLSREFTKELSGRYVPFRIRPFVYRELAEYGKELGKEISLIDYIIWGGFPKRIEYSSESSPFSHH